MFPLRDINPSRTKPIVTWSIIGLSSLVFIYQMSLGRYVEIFVRQWGLIPYEILTGKDIPPYIPLPVYTTLFSHMFLHGNLAHIIGNMWFLWIFGNNVEDELGKVRFIIFYLVSGFFAAMLQIFVAFLQSGFHIPPIWAIGGSLHPLLIPMIGASGAISGVLGAYMRLFPHAMIDTLVFWGFFVSIVRLPAIIFIGLWIIVQVINGLFSLGFFGPSGVAWFAHIGGFIAGYLLVEPFLPPSSTWKQRKKWEKMRKEYFGDEDDYMFF